MGPCSKFVDRLIFQHLVNDSKSDLLTEEMTSLLDQKSCSTQPILHFATEMLSVENTASEILKRLPRERVATYRMKPSNIVIGELEYQEMVISHNQSAINYIQLLKAAGFSTENIAALGECKNYKNSDVCLCKEDIDGWAHILRSNAEIIEKVNLLWCEGSISLFDKNVEYFFDSLRKSSVSCLSIKIDGSTSTHTDMTEQLKKMGAYIQVVMSKKGVRTYNSSHHLLVSSEFISHF